MQEILNGNINQCTSANRRRMRVCGDDIESMINPRVARLGEEFHTPTLNHYPKGTPENTRNL
jgi:hypothetical protein